MGRPACYYLWLRDSACALFSLLGPKQSGVRERGFGLLPKRGAGLLDGSLVFRCWIKGIVMNGHPEGRLFAGQWGAPARFWHPLSP